MIVAAPIEMALVRPALGPCVIIGNSVVGNLLAEQLRLHCRVTLVPARRLVSMAETTQLRRELDEGASVILAHGREVGARTFRRDYDELLASRIQPMQQVERLLSSSETANRVVLISSTVAAMPAPPRAPNLVSLQHEFEDAFNEIYRSRNHSIVRAAAILDEAGQIHQRLPRLRATLLVKRLRPRRRTAIPWVDRELLAQTVIQALKADSSNVLTAAHRDGLDWSQLMDQILGTRFTIASDALFFGAWWLLGVRSEFLKADVRYLWCAARAEIP